MNAQLACQAGERHYDFTAIGVSVGWSPEEGIDLLNEAGPFDEMAVGGNWGNLGSLRYMIDGESSASIPAVLVVVRRFDPNALLLRLKSEQIVAHHVGANAIVDWIEAGTPVTW